MFRMEIWQDGNCIHTDENFENEEEVEIAFREYVRDTIREYKNNGCKYEYTEDDFAYEMFEEEDGE